MVNYIARLFECVGNDEETIKWIKRFANVPKDKYAVIKISGSCIDDSLESITEDVGVLTRLDLYPTIIYGWGKSLTERLDIDNITYSWCPTTGDRITSPEAMVYAEQIAREYGHRLVESFKKNGINSRLLKRVISAEPIKIENMGENHRNGVITSIDKKQISREIEKGVVPIISPLGYYKDGRQMLNINGDTAGKEVVLSMGPLKYCQLTNTGGILNTLGEIINKIHLDKEYILLMRKGFVKGGMKKKIREAKEVIDKMNSDEFAVQIVHPDNLLTELFTDEGAGTYICQ